MVDRVRAWELARHRDSQVLRETNGYEMGLPQQLSDARLAWPGAGDAARPLQLSIPADCMTVVSQCWLVYICRAVQRILA
jgi:hypothetical protein